jgi:Mce-associated membrane protein
MAKHAVAARTVTEDVAIAGHCDEPIANDVAVQHGTDTRGQSADLDAGVELDGEPVAKKARMALTPIWLAAMVGIATVVALVALTGWLGHRAFETHRAQQQRELFLQVGRQGAVNLTTIDWEHADADTQRIVDSATGTFYDDFSTRSKAFADVVKQAKSKSVGTVTEAGMESESADQAQILVAVSVRESTVGAPQQEPRGWRMRVTVQKIGNDVKVANVGFVP